VSTLQTVVTRVPLDSLVGEDRVCNICKASFDGKEDGGHEDDRDVLAETETPVRTVCAAGQHLFGEQCLRHWLETHESCPYCRHTLLPFRITEQECDAGEEEAAKSRAIPDWITTLLWSNSKQPGE
jgi:hypothetical protein